MRRHLTLATLLPLLGGCLLLPSLSGPPPSTGRPLNSGEALQDIGGIVHCHSLLSGDSNGPIPEIAAAARESGLSFVILTDHLKAVTKDEGPNGWIDGVLFIPGFETRSDAGGSLFSLGARANIYPRGADRAIAQAIKAQGALVAFGHLEQRRAPLPFPADALETWNLHAEIAEDNKLGAALKALVLPPGAFFRSLLDRPDAALRRYDGAPQSRPPSAFGGCDAHRVVGALGLYVDSYARSFRALTTHVLTKKIDRKSILNALRRGRSYAATELDEDPTGFCFEGRHGEATLARLGDSRPAAAVTELVVSAPKQSTLVLLRDGQRVLSGTAALSLKNPRPGLYRAEAYLHGHPWILSSGIRLLPTPSARPKLTKEK